MAAINITLAWPQTVNFTQKHQQHFSKLPYYNNAFFYYGSPSLIVFLLTFFSPPHEPFKTQTTKCVNKVVWRPICATDVTIKALFPHWVKSYVSARCSINTYLLLLPCETSHLSASRKERKWQHHFATVMALFAHPWLSKVHFLVV